MADSKYFGIPFATSGDKATIPEATQPSGAISFTQGFGPDYERDPATDPLAKRVPRDETNELHFQVTNALKYLQLYGTPEWYEEDDAGNPVSYPLSARVRYDAGAGMQAWRSIVASNTATPGSDATKWAVDDPFNLGALEATLAEALAGTIGTKIITPRRLASSAQRGAWNFGTTTGTATAFSVSLAPAPASIGDGFPAVIRFNVAPGAGATLNVNGVGASPLSWADGSPVAPGQIPANVPTRVIFSASLSAWVIEPKKSAVSPWFRFSGPPGPTASGTYTSLLAWPSLVSGGISGALSQANGTFTASAEDAGTWIFHAGSNTQGASTREIVAIGLNTGIFDLLGLEVNSAVNGIDPQVTAIMRVSAGDVINSAYFQNSGGPQSMGTLGTSNFSGTRIGA